MPVDDDFLPRFGRPGRDRSFAGLVRRAANLARGGAAQPGGRSRFTGARIGRGAGVGRVLASGGRFASSRARRVVVKTYITKLVGKGAARATAHLRYLERDGTTREGERGALYGAETDLADRREFAARGAEDRHRFRFIVAAEDGAEYDDLKPLVRRLMTQAERDLGTKLDWVAVDHFNTGHPHSHIVVRGKDETGRDLVIAREYLTQGLRARAGDLVNLDLGPRSDRDILKAQAREIDAQRYTGIDRRLARSIGDDGLVTPAHRDGIEQAARAGRLQALGKLGLAVEERRGRWRLDPALETTLTAMARRGDIIATMHHELGIRQRSQNTADYAIYEPCNHDAQPVVGRVVTAGLSDDRDDRRYMIVEGIDGRTHHVDAGLAEVLPKPETIVRVSPTPVSVRQVDVTVAEIAAANGGRYAVAIHLRHDPTATERFAEAHVRRLEAIRRGTGGVTREADGSWVIAPDHIDRAKAYERQVAAKTPVRIDTLSTVAIEQLPAHDGATWLDRELIADTPARLGGGFGTDGRRAMAARQQWLIEQGLAQRVAGGVDYRDDLLPVLQRRELTRTAAQLSRELGLTFTEARNGEAVEGTLRRVVQTGDAKLAIVERAHEFSLVPWKPVLEKQIGKSVFGIMRDGGDISWTIGRSRGLGIS